MTGFKYNEQEKTIIIDDGKTRVIWENVENDIAEEASKMYKESKSIDSYLLNHNCKRFWGNKQ
jgi:hypothetical protein